MLIINKPPFVWASFATVIAFIVSCCIVVWKPVCLLILLFEFKNLPENGVWITILLMSIWLFITGIIYIWDMIVASQQFDLWLTGYLMLTWIGYTILGIYKCIQWGKLKEKSAVYANYETILIIDMIFLNTVLFNT